MQYHLNGVRRGDPDLTEAVESGSSHDCVEVLIVGCGSAGLTLRRSSRLFPKLLSR